VSAGLQLRFLGSGDAFGSGGRLQTCILLASDGFRCLLDCGATSLVALKRAGVDPNQIDTVLVTHLHGDHFGGLPFLVLDGQFSQRTRPLRIAGPPGLTERLERAMEVFFPGSAKAKRRFETQLLELAAGEAAVLGPLRVTPYEVVHACGAPPYALRVELGGRTVTYSGDTEWTEGLRAAAAGADLFIAEAYFFEKSVRFHLDYATLLRHRHELACERMIVTHMSDDVLARLPELAVEAAHDGLEVAL
jgi:ribonuclease BN (tRNA processing enzyme)